MGTVVSFPGIEIGSGFPYIYTDETGKNIFFRVQDSSDNLLYCSILEIMNKINSTLPSLINANKPKTTFVQVAAVATTQLSTANSIGFFNYYGLYNESAIMDAVDALCNSGHAVLGGWFASGNANDDLYASNAPGWQAMLSTVSNYYNVPYQWGFFSREYQTIRWTVAILYV